MELAPVTDNERVIELKKIDDALNCSRRKTMSVLEKNNVPIITVGERKRGVLAADLRLMLKNLSDRKAK